MSESVESELTAVENKLAEMDKDQKGRDVDMRRLARAEARNTAFEYEVA